MKLKFPDHYASNIKRPVNGTTGKLNGMKSHDYHTIIERLMSICGRYSLNSTTSICRFVLSKSQK
jgi:hypothetical protein